MRELIVNTFLSLDGVMQAPGGPEADPSGRVIMARYRTGAGIKGGSFAPETPSEAEVARRAGQER